MDKSREIQSDELVGLYKSSRASTSTVCDPTELVSWLHGHGVGYLSLDDFFFIVRAVDVVFNTKSQPAHDPSLNDEVQGRAQRLLDDIIIAAGPGSRGLTTRTRFEISDKIAMLNTVNVVEKPSLCNQEALKKCSPTPGMGDYFVMLFEDKECKVLREWHQVRDASQVSQLQELSGCRYFQFVPVSAHREYAAVVRYAALSVAEFNVLRGD